MLKISEFFKKIQKRQAKEIFVRSTLQVAIKNHTNIDLPVESIAFKEYSAVLNSINQSQKSQIFIKKQQIIQEFNLTQDIKKINDIR
ncbi:MAG: hypothetical protein AAB470_02145 [Patescibacteria group bacterium]